jgi:hypothetical protein
MLTEPFRNRFVFVSVCVKCALVVLDVPLPKGDVHKKREVVMTATEFCLSTLSFSLTLTSFKLGSRCYTTRLRQVCQNTLFHAVASEATSDCVVIQQRSANAAPEGGSDIASMMSQVGWCCASFAASVVLNFVHHLTRVADAPTKNRNHRQTTSRNQQSVLTNQKQINTKITQKYCEILRIYCCCGWLVQTVNQYIEQGIAELVPGVLFIDEVARLSVAPSTFVRIASFTVLSVVATCIDRCICWISSVSRICRARSNRHWRQSSYSPPIVALATFGMHIEMPSSCLLSLFMSFVDVARL